MQQSFKPQEIWTEMGTYSKSEVFSSHCSIKSKSYKVRLGEEPGQVRKRINFNEL
jgi:hypothetical protein